MQLKAFYKCNQYNQFIKHKNQNHPDHKISLQVKQTFNWILSPYLDIKKADWSYNLWHQEHHYPATEFHSHVVPYLIYCYLQQRYCIQF